MNSDFSPLLIDWYVLNKRDLPWRKYKDPYVIWLSEIILQQTRVNQGLPYFLSFLKRFPKVSDLANATENEVLKLWQGLGYYSRARNMYATAKKVAFDYNGVFPSSYKELIKLKGIGPYSASAIASFSSNEHVAVVDGNVYRVLARIYGVFTPINSSQGQKEFQKLALSLLPIKDSSTHNQAIMEFGAAHCTPKKPKCSSCVFQHNCYAFRNEAYLDLPVKIKKTKVKKRYINYLVQENKSHVFMRYRNQEGIWRNLYDFPDFEFETAVSKEQLLVEVRKEFPKVEDLELLEQCVTPHKLSHQHLYISYYSVKTAEASLNIFNGVPVLKDDFSKFPMPIVISRFISTLKKY